MVQASFTLIVDGDRSEEGPGEIEEVAHNIAARIEEMARTSEHLLDFSVTPYYLPDPSEASH